MNLWDHVPTLFVSMAAVMLFLWVISRKTKTAKHKVKLPELPAEFKVTAWIKTPFWILTILSVIAASIVLIYVREPEKLMIGLGLPGGFGLLGGLGVFTTMEKLRITETTLTYKKPIGGFSLPLDSIKGVQTGLGCIHIDTGKNKPSSIPMTFKGSGQILNFLESLVKR